MHPRRTGCSSRPRTDSRITVPATCGWTRLGHGPRRYDGGARRPGGGCRGMRGAIERRRMASGPRSTPHARSDQRARGRRSTSRKVTGVPYEEIARRGGGSPLRPVRWRRRQRGRARPGARRSARDALGGGRRRSRARPATGSRARASCGSSGSAARSGDRVTGLFAHSIPEGYDAAGWMDVVDELAAEADVDALDIYVESVAFRNEDLERLGEIARREGVPLRAHVEQFNANRSVPVALAAGGVGRPPRLPAPRRPRAARRRRVRRRAAAGSRVPGSRGAGAGAGAG